MENINQVDCRLVSVSTDPLVDQVEVTYTDSFPVEERRPFALVRQLIDKEPMFHLYVIERDYTYAGFITIWDFNEFAYVEHFAIDPTARNGGIGKLTLDQIKSIVGRPIVLEVELPVDEMSKRRVTFYERSGFTLYNHTYFQPPYYPGGSDLELRLMSTGAYLSDTNFEFVKNSLHKKVYGIK